MGGGLSIVQLMLPSAVMPADVAMSFSGPWLVQTCVAHTQVVSHAKEVMINDHLPHSCVVRLRRS
jgi:hypothetical protein